MPLRQSSSWFAIYSSLKQPLTDVTEEVLRVGIIDVCNLNQKPGFFKKPGFWLLPVQNRTTNSTNQWQPALLFIRAIRVIRGS